MKKIIGIATCLLFLTNYTFAGMFDNLGASMEKASQVAADAKMAKDDPKAFFVTLLKRKLGEKVSPEVVETKLGAPKVNLGLSAEGELVYQYDMATALKIVGDQAALVSGMLPADKLVQINFKDNVTKDISLVDQVVPAATAIADSTTPPAATTEPAAGTGIAGKLGGAGLDKIKAVKGDVANMKNCAKAKKDNAAEDAAEKVDIVKKVGTPEEIQKMDAGAEKVDIVKKVRTPEEIQKMKEKREQRMKDCESK